MRLTILPHRCRRWGVIGTLLASAHCGDRDSTQPTFDGAADGTGRDADRHADGPLNDATRPADGLAVSDADAGSTTDAPASTDAGPDRPVDSPGPDGDASVDAADAPPFADVDAAPPSGDTSSPDAPSDLGSSEGDATRGAIIVTPLSGLSTSEGGGIATFSMVLASPPFADVIVGLSSSRPTEGDISVTQLTFTPGNWSVLQSVAVTGVDDSLCDGNQVYAIVTAPSVSLDPRYDGIDPSDVVLNNIDNEGGGITVSAGNLVTTEAGGGTASFYLFLNCEPTADVTIPIASTDTGEVTVSTASIVFTPTNWNAPRTVTTTGVDDAVDDGDQVVPVTIGPAVSADLGFDGIVAPSAQVTNVDDD